MFGLATRVYFQERFLGKKGSLLDSFFVHYYFGIGDKELYFPGTVYRYITKEQTILVKNQPGSVFIMI